MSSEERIAAVLREHPLHWNETDCVCAWNADDNSDHATHLAAVALAALNLTEEWNVLTDMGVKSHAPLTEERARHLEERFEDMTARRRLVTPWEEA